MKAHLTNYSWEIGFARKKRKTWEREREKGEWKNQFTSLADGITREIQRSIIIATHCRKLWVKKREHYSDDAFDIDWLHPSGFCALHLYMLVTFFASSNVHFLCALNFVDVVFFRWFYFCSVSNAFGNTLW